MGRYISRTDDKHVVKFWIDAESESALVDEIGRQLARRKDLSASDLRETLRRTLSEYDLARSMLASWGLAHERAGHTERVFEGLVTAYVRAIRA
jgi:hypothetical protein